MRKLFLIAALALVMLAPRTSQATATNAGRSGAQFLKIGAGARSTAMGDAFSGISDDVNAVYFNAAGLAFTSRPELTGMRTQWFQGMDYDFGAFSYPTESGAFALSACTLQASDIERRSSDESFQGTFAAMDEAYGLSYARMIGPQLAFGATARRVQEKIDTASAGAWSGDLSLLRKFGNSPYTLGLAVRHLGQSIKFRNESDPLPRVVDLGLGLNLLRDRLTIGADLKSERDNGLQYALGGEFKGSEGQNLRWALRGGYSTALTSNGSGLTLGAGIGYQRIDFDFAWVPFGDLGNTFRYALHVRF